MTLSMHCPYPRFRHGLDGRHSIGEHVAAISVPALHEDVPDTVYPELHVGWHVDTLRRELEQSPAPPFVGAADASHGFAEHVAAISVPALHEDVPDTVYPELHVGWHVDALRRELEQSPAPPFVGAADASHVMSSAQVVPVYPAAQVQVKLFTRSEHLPPFRHGLEAHSS